jgi:NAD(P)-dependent dehydrogenase (short-subunit alcohol dehydrogenase family)
LQSLAGPLQRQRAAITFVGPSLSLVGAAGLAGLVAFLESQRGLAKSLARQWGKHGVTCNWVALDARELSPDFGRFRLPTRTEAVPLALGRRPDAAADLGGVLDFLAGSAGRVVTGTTICLDGGEWMVP